MICPRCQAESPERARFGARLEVACPSCGQPVGLGKKLCRSCGAPVALSPFAFPPLRPRVKKKRL